MNVLDAINEDASRASGQLASQDKKFFSELFDKVADIKKPPRN